MADGSAFVGAYLPLIVSSGGVEVPLGSIGFGWPAPRVLDAAERETLTALAGLAAVASTAPGSPRPPRSAPSGSSGWPTPTR